MPPKPPESNPWELVILVVGFIAVMLGLLWARGGLSAITSGSQPGLFLQSPLTPIEDASSTPAATTDTSSNTTNY